jgi:hypothetical protein
LQHVDTLTAELAAIEPEADIASFEKTLVTVSLKGVKKRLDDLTLESQPS